MSSFREEELKKRKTYLQIAGTACSNCRKTCNEANVTSLLRCARCRMSHYCSKECQKADFQFHKVFCLAIEELSNNEQAWYSCNGLELEWNKRKIYQMQLLGFILDRDLNNYERLAWLNQPKCQICFKCPKDLKTSQALIPCSNCQVVFCCCPEHWKKHRSKHDDLCETYQIMTDCERIRYLPDQSLWAPEDYDENKLYPPLPKDWNGYFKWRKASIIPQRNDSFCRVITNTLSLPLTILSALSRFYTHDQLHSINDLVIHIVGANQYELSALMTFEEIMHVLPDLKVLHLVMIGPEMTPKHHGFPLRCCPRCTTENRMRVISMYPMIYHEFANSSDYSQPHLAIGFNKDLGEDDFELWKPTIEFLLDKNLPCAFTSYSKKEAIEDVRIIKELGALILVGAKENKWSSNMPLVEPQEVDKFYYNNFYRTLFQGRAKNEE
ncbi:11736_t:CDS:1 [Funneliformis caledonium]|uniref:11736_t:CDS:1 n=2 Tax=Funneliformis TaxID=1117308 RepID=A0A9N9DTN5_9GLOM|nr:11736_t:CDS:1 [Funneliformis caledonium]CAG8649347.1 5929_t:CDS:1 [Funneliformis mosseae]